MAIQGHKGQWEAKDQPAHKVLKAKLAQWVRQAVRASKASKATRAKSE